MSAEQRIALRGHRQQNSSNGRGKNSDTERTMQRGNFLAIINVFSALDAALIEHSEKDAKDAKMVSWQIQNDVIEYLSEFVCSKIKDGIQDYCAIITDEVTDRFSNKEILLFCLCYVRFCTNEKPYICETFFDSLHIQGSTTCQTIGNSILLLVQINGIDLSKCRVQAYDRAYAMNSEATGAVSVIKNEQPLAEYAQYWNHIWI